MSIEFVLVKRAFDKGCSHEKLIDNEMKKVRFFPSNLQNKKREKGVLFVATYNAILNSLSKIIGDNNYLLI